MEFPKEVVCINDKWDELPRFYAITGQSPPKKDQVYRAIIVYKGLNGIIYYVLKEYPRDFGFKIEHFADLDIINISEVTEVLQQEPIQV